MSIKIEVYKEGDHMQDRVTEEDELDIDEEYEIVARQLAEARK